MQAEPIFSIQTLDRGEVGLVQFVLYLAVGWNDPPGLPAMEQAMEHPQLSRFHREWGRAGDFGVKADLDGEVAGAAFARLFTDDDHGEGFVDANTPEVVIAIETQFRRQGLGAQLMEALAAEARRLGFEQISLAVNHANPARHLYQALGYQTVGDDGRSLIMLLDL
jgi:GNAT superfamily N-acetyltransferase